MNPDIIVSLVIFLFAYLTFIITSSPPLNALKTSFDMLCDVKNCKVYKNNWGIHIKHFSAIYDIAIRADFKFIFLYNKKCLGYYYLNPYNIYWLKKIEKQFIKNERCLDKTFINNSKQKKYKSFIK